MSSIAFTSPSGTVTVAGRERFMMGSICNDFRRMQTGDFRYGDLSWVKLVVKPDHYLHKYALQLDAARNASQKAEEQERLAKALDTFLHVGDMSSDEAMFLDGKPFDLFHLALNSAVEWGNRSIQLCAKLHAQSEIHAYCEGADRAWLADLIQEALDCQVFRADPFGHDGWQAVIEFLRSRDDEPVVTSFSVTDSFPNQDHAPDGFLDEDPDTAWEQWDEVSDTQKWEWGMAAIRAVPSLQINAEMLSGRYGHSMSGRDFMERVHAMQKQAAEAVTALD